MDCTVYGIIQARTLEWVVVPSLGDLPDPGIEPRSPALQVDSIPGEPPGSIFYAYAGINTFNLLHTLILYY